jgi:HEAT repeat protein
MGLLHTRILLAAAWLCTTASAALALAGPTPADIQKTVAAIRGYDYGGSETALRAVEHLIHDTNGSPALRAAIEKELIAVLQSDVSPACKQFICRKLAIVGAEASLPALAKMLASDDTAAVEIACYSLAQINSPAVNGVLHDGLGRAKGKALAAIVTLLGTRQDQESVGPLMALTQGKDAMVAEAAIAALGKISGKEAAAALARLCRSDGAGIRAAAQHASLECARQLAAKGDPAEAKAIYQGLHESDAPLQVRRGALLGMIALGGTDAAFTVMYVLTETDCPWTADAIAAIPTLRDTSLAVHFADKLADLPARKQVLLINALVRLGNPDARAAIVRAAMHREASVRLAAIKGLGTIGDASTVSVLVRALAGDRPADAEAAAASLRVLNADGADAAIVKCMQAANGRLRIELIRVLSDRRASAAVPALLAEAVSTGAAARQAAFRALGAVAGQSDLPAVIKLLVALKDEGSRTDAEQAAANVARKAAERAKAADALLGAFQAAQDAPTRCSLIRVLRSIPEDRVCSAIVKAAGDSDTALKDAAIRALADWPDARAAAPLMAILESGPSRMHRTLVLRGYVRLLAAARETPAVLAGKYAQAMAHAQGPDDTKLILGALAEVPDPRALKLATDCLRQTDVRIEAATAAMAIAGKLPESQSAHAVTAMNAVIASVGDGPLKEQAKALIRRVTPKN